VLTTEKRPNCGQFGTIDFRNCADAEPRLMRSATGCSRRSAQLGRLPLLMPGLGREDSKSSARPRPREGRDWQGHRPRAPRGCAPIQCNPSHSVSAVAVGKTRGRGRAGVGDVDLVAVEGGAAARRPLSGPGGGYLVVVELQEVVCRRD
jgi:hypothetical protein